MPVNFQKLDSVEGERDLENEFITESWLVDQFVGNTLFSWGNNVSGELGLSDQTNRSSPVQVGSLTAWKQVVSGSNMSFGIKTDGTLWSWGSNYGGGLGLNLPTSVKYSSPVQVGPLTEWRSASTSIGNRTRAFFIKNNGTLWACGYNTLGELGVSVSTSLIYSSPVQVGSLTNWKQVDSGNFFTMAIKTDGTLWAWGGNASGKLGINQSDGGIKYSSPIQVGSLTDWRQVACGYRFWMAIKTDGTLWGCGYNSFGGGMLGLGDSVNRSSPTQVGSLTNWREISCGYDNAAAIKTDGSLWAWGGYGGPHIGLNTSATYSSPVQVGSLTTWKSISCGYYHTSAIKTDGTLWSWGYGISGASGLNNTVNYSSPVQVGSLTNWKQVATRGYYSSLAITYREI